MLHYFQGSLATYWEDSYLLNEQFWVQVFYSGSQQQGVFFLYPYLEEQKKTFSYFAFDTAAQKSFFEKMLKISGVWPKTAFQLAQLDPQAMQKAIDQVDFSFFQSIPGIGPKSSKKILIELKDHFQASDLYVGNQQQKILDALSKTLKTLGYDANQVKELLKQYPGDLLNDEKSVIIKRVIGKL